LDLGLKFIRAAALVLPVLLLLAAVSDRPALAWGDWGHLEVADEAVQRLPEPLHGLLADEGALRRLKAASLEPDRRVEELRKAKSPELARERVKHYFDIDGITSEPFPFAHFPRDRRAAEKEFGKKPFEEHGTAPWVIEDAEAALVDALRRGATEEIFKWAGEVSHFGADLHMPFHCTKNYNGKLTGNTGIHKMLEIGLLVRHKDFYAAEIRKGRAPVPYVEDAEGRLFDWLIVANSRAAPILEADTAARLKTGYTPPEKVEEADKELDDVNSARAKPYYAAFKSELESRGQPEAAALRDAADHVAQLFYTAWVRAGKPAGLTAPPTAAAAAAPPTIAYWWLVVPTVVLILLSLFRRRPVKG
jgi:hypothetical protein